MTAAPPAPRFALDIDGVPRPERSQQLLEGVRERVVIADGAMGTMLQRYDLSIDGDFQGLEGCNEILNVSRPDVVAAIHDAYLEVGVDARRRRTRSARTGRTSATTASTTASSSWRRGGAHRA